MRTVRTYELGGKKKVRLFLAWKKEGKRKSKKKGGITLTYIHYLPHLTHLPTDLEKSKKGKKKKSWQFSTAVERFERDGTSERVKAFDIRAEDLHLGQNYRETT